MAWDPGSGKKPIPDPGVKKAPDSGSGSATLRFTFYLEPYFPYLIERISLLASRRNIKTFVDHVAV
jgi:hypothetical protein